MATRLTSYRRSILTQYNTRKQGMSDFVFCKHHKIKMQELECWKTLAATEVAEVVFANKAEEGKKIQDDKASPFDREIFSMIEISSGRPAGDALISEEADLIEKIRMTVMLKVASLPCTMKHVDHLLHLEDYIDAIR